MSRIATVISSSASWLLWSQCSTTSTTSSPDSGWHPNHTDSRIQSVPNVEYVLGQVAPAGEENGLSIQTGNNGNGEGNGNGDSPEPRVNLGVLPERHLIRMSGSHRHVVFTVGVEAAPKPDQAARTPLRLALVIDRSCSMWGGELATAKQAVLAVLAQLD